MGEVEIPNPNRPLVSTPERHPDLSHTAAQVGTEEVVDPNRHIPPDRHVHPSSQDELESRRRFPDKPRKRRPQTVKTEESAPFRGVPSEQDQLELALKCLRPGQMAYSTPEKMKTGQMRRVTAILGVKGVDVLSGLPSDQKKASEATPISTKMRMTLKGSDFGINSTSQEVQFVDNETPTVWTWEITPKHAGKLTLRLAAIVEIGEIPKEITTIDREITVQVDPVNEAELFIKTSWQWIIATITALGGAIWSWIKTRHKTPPPAKSWESV
jgi:hypothetical protein